MLAFCRLWVDDGGDGDTRPVWDFWGTDLALADAVLGDLRRRALAVFSRGVGIDPDRSVLAAVGGRGVCGRRQSGGRDDYRRDYLVA